jgi:hypothetical protein
VLPTERLIPAPEPLQKWLETGGGCLPGIGSLIVRREAYDAVGGFEASFRGLYEDQAFLSKMAARFPVAVIAEVLDYYRQHPASSCSRGIAAGEYRPSLTHPSRRRYLFWLEEYLERHGVDDEGVQLALENELRPYKSRVYGWIFDTRRGLPIWFKQVARRILPASVWRSFRIAKLSVRGWRAARAARRSQPTSKGQAESRT